MTLPAGGSRGAAPALALYRFLGRLRPAILAQALKSALRLRRRVVEAREGRFWIDPVSNLGLGLLARGEIEPGMAANLRDLLGEGDTFVDLGSNEGYFAVVAAGRVGPRGRVLAVEPQRRLREVILHNAGLNGLENIALSDRCVSDHDGTETLFLAPDTNTGSSGLVRMTRYPLRSVRIPCVRLSTLFDEAGIEGCALLKVDIEGAEHKAILGSRELFESGRVRHIALELHPAQIGRIGGSPAEIAAFLESAGYRKSRMRGHEIWSRTG